MAERAIREFDGKQILARLLPEYIEHAAQELAKPVFQRPLVCSINESVHADLFDEGVQSALASEHAWLSGKRLVVKPDQLIKRRGKAGLLGLNLDFSGVMEWLRPRWGKELVVEGVSGQFTTALIEPFCPHTAADEVYVCVLSERDGETILFHHEGGVDIGDVESKACKLFVPIGTKPSVEALMRLCASVAVSRQAALVRFLAALFDLYMDLHFVYLEINPLVLLDTPEGLSIVPLDLAAKVDEAAAFLCGAKWAISSFPPPFGRRPEPEEAYIRELDGKTGASLKLTILNRNGRVWTMVAGGGASVVYADTISDLGFGHELANYGEYSGAPSEEQTYEYAKTILKLMGSAKLPLEDLDAVKRGAATVKGKVLIIGGGIANFTDVAKTFTGIIRALREAQAMLKEHGVSVWVRRGGPNYQEGLKLMAALGEEIGVPIHVHGPDTHITAIVPMALGVPDTHHLTVTAEMHNESIFSPSRTPSNAAGRTPTNIPRTDSEQSFQGEKPSRRPSDSQIESVLQMSDARASYNLFNPATRCIVFGMQQRAVQGMLDFDWLCKRETPSVACMVFPFSGNHFQKFYWGHTEVMMPVYTTVEEAVRRHPEVSVFVNFASFRSVFQTTMDALAHPTINTIAIIAEGVPEQQSRALIQTAKERGVVIIGPATVGGIAPGCFRIGNTGGMLDNIISCKLYRPGSVGYVSKSGGMSNELNNIMGQHTDGVCEGVAIGGDRYPGSLFIDHLLRYQANPRIQMLVLLGEVGGVDEYEVAAAIRDGRITKPVVAWCIGTCAKMFPFEVQFGHAGALANGEAQTADAKNRALKAAGAIVPDNFNDFVARIRDTYLRLVDSGVITVVPETAAPKMPMDFAWAKSLGLIRKPASFVSSISDDRGEELLYAGVPISKVFEEDLGVGGVLSLLWFRRRLPAYATKFIEMVLMVTADHGPAVSGAHNTIVTARAGKDLISSLCSGLLTIGPRFGGALDDAADQFSKAYDSGTSPNQFVKEMRAANKLIMGIGHRVKSLTNPDKRVVIIKEFAFKHFPSTDVLKFALAVEQLTTAKKENLILNVDGAIAVCFVDLLRSCGCFTREEADETIANGCLNGLFVVGRSIGFIGHFLDQVRLKQGLYRHPTDDITYMDSAY